MCAHTRKMEPEIHLNQARNSRADATGGEFIPTSNMPQMEPNFELITELLRTQYALEFHPAGVSPGRKGMRIRITCSRPGVKIVAGGYH